MKDDLIDEEKARQEEAAHETLKQKIDRQINGEIDKQIVRYKS